MNTEDRFTAARPDCPHPDRWHSSDDDSTEIEVSELVAAFIRALQPDFVVETGTAWGQTAELIGQALKANGQGRLVTLEPDPERAEFSRQRCVGLPVLVLEKSSLDYTPAGPVDFAWFDSLFHLRPQELARFRPWFTPRTVVGFHDTGPQHPVRHSLEQLVADGLLEPPLFLPTPRGVAFACPR